MSIPNIKLETSQKDWQDLLDHKLENIFVKGCRLTPFFPQANVVFCKDDEIIVRRLMEAADIEITPEGDVCLFEELRPLSNESNLKNLWARRAGYPSWGVFFEAKFDDLFPNFDDPKDRWVGQIWLIEK